jgi:hypothetical protein
LHTLQTRIELRRSECPRLNGMLVWLDHLVSFQLNDIDKKSQF